jgi:hypothetical protein
MSSRKEIFDLVKKHLPNEPRSGKGVTIKSLESKLKSAGIDLKIGKKATSSPEEATRPKQSPSKRPKPQPELFPYGPGYELIDAAILEFLTDAELGKAC